MPSSATLRRYAIAAATVVVATAARFTLVPVLGSHYPFLTFFAAVLFAAWQGGFGPSMVTLALSSLSAGYFFAAPGSLAVPGSETQIAFVVFVAVCLAIGLMGGAMRKAQWRAEVKAREGLVLLAAEHEMRERLDITLKSLSDAVLSTDWAGRVVSLNPTAEALTGWTTAEAAGQPLEEVFRAVAEATGEPVESPVARVLRTVEPATCAVPLALVCRDGVSRPIDLSAAPIRDAIGAIRGVVLVFRDVAEERAAQGLVRDSEERYRTILESVTDAFYALDRSWRFTYVNHQAEALLGRSRGDLLGKVFWDEFAPAVATDVHPNYHRAMSEGVTVSFETYYPPHDRWYEVHAYPSAAGLSVYFRNITERRGADAALRAAKDEAEQANRAKDQFLAVLSHELRTPLNPILLAASSMLERPSPPEEFRPTMEMIRHNVNLQAQLIDDLLDVMRIVQGKMPLHWGVADCHQVIGHAIRICQSEVFGRTIRLELDLAARDHHVNADSARLQQVFWNLIKNAVKFSPEGGVLTIRTRNEGGQDDGGRLVIEVQDTGIGIDAAVLPAIFDPFQQGETSITRRFGGLGLGLAICRGVVEAHGGTITADSPGKALGTTFRVVLEALASPAADRQAPAASVPARPPEAAVPWAKLKVLVVEDEESTRRLMARLLRAQGHEVATAGTIFDGIAAAEADAFDLIVSDIGLPDGSGLELMRRVVARRGRVPSIALTGYGMEEDIVRSREAGFTAHMTKPIDFAKLEALIRQIAC